MNRRTTYKKLIFKIILSTLVISLSVAFFYAQYMKKDAIEKLTKVDAKKTTQLVFQSLYSAMEKGWDRNDLEKIIHRLNNVDKNMRVDVYRSYEVAKQFGEIKKDLNARKNNHLIKQALNNTEVLNIVDDKSIDYYYPLVAKDECLKCHTQTTTGSVLGVININYPIKDLKVSLSSIINFFLIFIIIFTLVIFFALFTKFDKHLVKPIKIFIANINSISNEKNITKRVTIEDNNVEEIESMQIVFNDMLDSIEFQFYNDSLTSLPNRKRLIEVISNYENGVLVIIDIDKFQEINDLYGDIAGDEILKETSDILKKALPISTAQLFKLHADEYAIYYPSDLSYNEIEKLASHISNVIENTDFEINGTQIYISVTMGVAYGNTFLLNYSDIALKLAKKNKKRFLIYDSSMHMEYEYEQNLHWTKKIKDAITNDMIEPLYQPIVNTKTKEIVKYEALMRMVDKNGEYIAPIHFLQLAKKNKLYPELTKIILIKTFQKAKTFNVQISINLSVEDILNKYIHQIILEKLNEYKLGNKIVFEILESEGIENFAEVKQFIKEVKKTGAKISIDDFGTGYSNFEYLMKLNVDYIKIDASMIRNIDKNKNSQIVTETIINFANKMGIKTIAEFVHSADVYKTVKKMGVDYSQGYYFGEPKRLD
ncbi:MAG: EAL domain-containing protein [Halarcobacter sp.]